MGAEPYGLMLQTKQWLGVCQNRGSRSGPCGGRTHDTRIKSPVLCQLS